MWNIIYDVVILKIYIEIKSFGNVAHVKTKHFSEKNWN